MCLGAPTSHCLAALSSTRFWLGWLAWRRIILRLLATHDPNNFSYARPQLEMAAKQRYPLTRARSRASASRSKEIAQIPLERRPAPVSKVPLGREVRPILLEAVRGPPAQINLGSKAMTSQSILRC